MPDPELVEFIRTHIPQYGGKALREQLIKDGVAPDEIEAAMAEALRPPVAAKPRGKLALYALFFGAILLVVAAYLSMGPADKQALPAVSKRPETDASLLGDSVFRGHYGYIFKLPQGYLAIGTFADAAKITEVVYIYPSGTDPTNFIHEGLYGHFGIMRMEVSPRRIPQGFITIENLQTWVSRQLKNDRVTFTMRQMSVGGLNAFIINITEPFPSVKAYIVGRKVFYMLYAGAENQMFTDILSSLVEVSPHDRPGTP